MDPTVPVERGPSDERRRHGYGAAMDLQGKVALVTGASGDIGGAIATALAAEGCRLAATYVGFADGAQAIVDAARAPMRARRSERRQVAVHVVAVDVVLRVRVRNHV